MTIREQFNNLLKQRNEECLGVFYKKYQLIFKMPAVTFTKQISQTFKEADKSIKVNPVYEVVGDYYKMQEMEESEIYNKTISLSISIQKESNIKKVVLLKNLSAKDEHEFKFGEFKIDIFELLLNKDIEHKQLIDNACWKAIAENLKDYICIVNESKNM